MSVACNAFACVEARAAEDIWGLEVRIFACVWDVVVAAAE